MNFIFFKKMEFLTTNTHVERFVVENSGFLMETVA